MVRKNGWSSVLGRTIRTTRRLVRKYGPYAKTVYKVIKGANNFLKKPSGRISGGPPSGGGRYVSIAAKKRARYGPGRLAGFVGKGKKVRKTDIHAKILKQGAYMTTERSIDMSGDDTVYVGHANMPYQQTFDILGMAMFKAACVSLGIVVRDWNETLTDVGFASADQFVLVWRNDRETTTNSSSLGFLVSTLSNCYSMANAFAGKLKALGSNAELLELYFYPNLPTSLLRFQKWNLTNTTVMFNSKSSFKFQNRSVNETGDDQKDDVDNVPLNGKSYAGSGSGTEWNNSTKLQKPFYADDKGLIQRDGDVEGIKEPPFGQLFAKVKQLGKIRVNPGDIKTSVLTTKQSFNLNRFITLMPVSSSTLTYPVMKVGKFQFFALEKVIGGLSEQQINVASEANLLIGCIVKLGKPDYTTSLFLKSVAVQ